jgi:tetratricopeptide (TPR) repeat protein
MLRAVLIVSFSLLTACAAPYGGGRGAPAPVETRESATRSIPPSGPSVTREIPSGEAAPTDRRDSGVIVTPESPAPTPAPSAPAPVSPVSSLLASADAAIAAGQLEQAAAICERALRISPRDGHVWYRLASIRFQQQRFTDAAGLAQRALSFAGSDAALTRDSNALLQRANAAMRERAAR